MENPIENIKKYKDKNPEDAKLITDFLDLERQLIRTESYMFSASHKIAPEFLLINEPSAK
jgi:hypothetical protein